MSAFTGALDRYWRAPAPAARLAALRIIIGGFALGYVVIRSGNLGSYAGLPDAQFDAVGAVSLLSGPMPETAVELLPWLAALAGLGFVLGWRYAITGPAFALLLLWVTTYRNSWGQIFHTENLLVLHVLVLALSPAADALSLDARGRSAAAPDDGRYGWPIRLMCLLTVMTYFITGQTKLRNAGLDWITSDSLRNYVAYDNLRKAELGDTHSFLGAELVSHGWLFQPLAVFTLAVELGAPLALLSRGVARFWVAAAWSFHLGVLAVMAIVFPYPLLGAAFAPFFEVERLPRPGLLPSRLPRHAGAATRNIGAKSRAKSSIDRAG
ncbi:MAG TPA: HTTM domain-containing protein [Dehalococcoidia bacterium]|nr:HTTM domain-containing protein [Dehalococcoidia bacterium]